MPLGGLAPLPLRLGGSPTDGLTAAQHARIAADWLASRRVLPIAAWTYTLNSGVITLHSYIGQNGAGSAYAWTYAVEGTGKVSWNYEPRSFVTPYYEDAPLALRSVSVGAHGSVCIMHSADVFANGVRICTFDDTGAATDAKVTVAVY